VVLRRRDIDYPALTILRLQIGQLLLGPAHQRTVGKTDYIVLQLSVE
jgi:hypothetical protein